MVKHNINDDCTVVLTDYGVRIMEKNDPTMAEFNFNIKTNLLTTQLWCLMNAFGEAMNQSAKQVFEHNEITFF